tara:strand:- start:113473 stop:114015 length:543 start_codon:yes stop_codon:yes gene_type:complete
MTESAKEPIRLLRDVNAFLVPSGDRIKLAEGSIVQITQALGGNYTVLVNNNMVQISSENADALGIKDEPREQKLSSGDFSEHQVWDQLKTCYDPEIPVNIVDLGLIYDLKIKDGKHGKLIEIKMTLTAPGCGMGDLIAGEAERKVRGINEVESVSVELVWEPLWNRDMMTEAAQLELGML